MWRKIKAVFEWLGLPSDIIPAAFLSPSSGSGYLDLLPELQEIVVGYLGYEDVRTLNAAYHELDRDDSCESQNNLSTISVKASSLSTALPLF